jgi:putative nucleotidyltransferase with HDIG domain
MTKKVTSKRKPAGSREPSKRWLQEELEIYRFLGDIQEKAGFSLEKLLDRFLGRIMKLLGAAAGTVFSVDAAGLELLFLVVRGKASEDLKGKRIPSGEGIAGWVARSGKPKIIQDVKQNPRWLKEVARLIDFPTRDMLVVPLRARSGKLVGVLELLNKKGKGGFTSADLEHLMALSGPVGNLLENTRLWGKTHLLNQQLALLNKVSHLVASTLDPREVRRRTIDAATRLVDCEVGSLLLLDPETGELYFEVALGERGSEVKKVRLKPGEGIAGWVVKHGKPVVVDDCDKDPRWSGRADQTAQFKTRSMICVPVRIRGQVIGALQAINRKNGRFDAKDVDLLNALADQVAVALENAHLFEEVQRTLVETSEALAEAIDLRDPYTGGHTRRVTEYSLVTGRQMGLDEKDLEELRLAAILHDIGKIGVDDQVLRKPGRLDEGEYLLMKKHPHLGASILDKIRYLTGVIPGIRSHHERNDGQGYPDGLNGQNIPLLARIIAVADTYDAMTSDRPYRKGLDKNIAIEEIRRCSGTQFDPAVVQSFLQAFRGGGITGQKEAAQSSGKQPAEMKPLQQGAQGRDVR